jgi:hypothetical protein
VATTPDRATRTGVWRHWCATELSPYVDNLRRELMVAAGAGVEDARTLAERLVSPLESAIRRTLLDALSTAADEITRALAPTCAASAPPSS